MATNSEPVQKNNSSFEKLFKERVQSSLGELSNLYNQVYAYHPDNKDAFDRLLETITTAFNQRPDVPKR